MPDTPAPLEPLTESWERLLCVVAHPDDIEYGAAAAVARWTGQGKWVGYCLVTSGEAGIDAMPPEECRAVREAEEIESARIVGVHSVDFLGRPDGVLEYGVSLRRVIAAAVRRHRPDVVLTGNFRDTWDGASALNPDPPISACCAPPARHAGCVADARQTPGMSTRRRLASAPVW